MIVGYLGLLLQGACLLAIGTYISSCTRNQIVAAVATFSVLLLLWGDRLGRVVPGFRRSPRPRHISR